MNIELSPEMKSLLIATSSICPWSFVQGLVQRFGSHVAPPGTFHFFETRNSVEFSTLKT